MKVCNLFFTSMAALYVRIFRVFTLILHPHPLPPHPNELKLSMFLVFSVRYTVFLNIVISNSTFISISTKIFPPRPVFPSILVYNLILVKMSKPVVKMKSSPLCKILHSESSFHITGRNMMSSSPPGSSVSHLTDNKQDTDEVLAIKRKQQWVQLTSKVYLQFTFYSTVSLRGKIFLNSKHSKRRTRTNNFLETSFLSVCWSKFYPRVKLPCC